MTRVTESERLFRAFCTAQGIAVSPVPTGAARTPDFRIFPRGGEVIVELKELTPGASEVPDSMGVYSTQLGERVRDCIGYASGQLPTPAAAVLPTMLVLWGGGELADHLHVGHITAAMFGNPVLHISVTHPPAIVGRSHGGGRKMDGQRGRRFSALAVLDAQPWRSADFSLDVYHGSNPAVPLPPAWLASADVAQWVPVVPVAGGTVDWERI